MTDTPESSKPKSRSLPWVKVPTIAEEKVESAAGMTGFPIQLVTYVWLQIQTSAQNLDNEGEFKVNLLQIAARTGTPRASIDAIMAAFSDPEIQIIVGGKCATFVATKPSADQTYRRNKKLRGAASEPSEEVADAPLSVSSGIGAPGSKPARGPKSAGSASRTEASASRTEASASRSSTESSESIEREDSTTLPVVVSAEPPREDALTTTTGELISEIYEGCDRRIPRSVISDGLLEIEKWRQSGFDLSLDIVPGLADLSARLKRPLGSMARAFVEQELRNFREARLADRAAAIVTTQRARAGPRGASRSGNRSYLGTLKEIRDVTSRHEFDRLAGGSPPALTFGA